MRLEAAAGKESAVADFFKQGQALVEAEPGTIVWSVFQMGPSTFGIVDAFEDEDGRQAHLNGKVAQG
ncbi:MAG: putative quinol monooxygenase, partial [Solirubrobacteraceae bacterium]